MDKPKDKETVPADFPEVEDSLLDGVTLGVRRLTKVIQSKCQSLSAEEPKNTTTFRRESRTRSPLLEHKTVEPMSRAGPQLRDDVCGVGRRAPLEEGTVLKGGDPKVPGEVGEPLTKGPCVPHSTPSNL